jgi:hypothetical protein
MKGPFKTSSLKKLNYYNKVIGPKLQFMYQIKSAYPKIMNNIYNPNAVHTLSAVRFYEIVRYPFKKVETGNQDFYQKAVIKFRQELTHIL